MRGYQKRVIYLKNTGSRNFEEAYFVDSKADGTIGSSYGEAPSFSTQQEPKFEEIPNDDDLPF